MLRSGTGARGAGRALKFLGGSGLLALLLMLAACGEMRPPGSREYVVHYAVERGDTLYSIAWRYDLDYRQVAAWNGIEPPYAIYPGQRIAIIPPNRFDGPHPRRERAGTPSDPVAAPPSRDTGKPTAATRSVAEAAKSRPAPVKAVGGGHQAKSVGGIRSRGGLRWRWPTEGEVVQGFSGTKRKGINIGGRPGQPVFAAAPGDVVYSGDGLIGYGNLVIIKHDDTFLSAYGHNRKLLVREGQSIKSGEKIAEMGQTPKGASILHFEIRHKGKPVDPTGYLPKD